MIHVIGLLARAGHGKSTAAKLLRDEFGAEIVSLAAPLKRIAKVALDFSDEQLWGTQQQKEAIDPRYGLSPRIFLQRLGTEGLRAHLGELVFCHALREHVAQRHTQTGERQGVFVIDDVRFQNECRFIDDLDRLHGTPKMFGHVFKIVCTDAPPSGNDDHASEREIDEVRDHLICDTVISSRAQGVDHLMGELRSSLLARKGLRYALREQAALARETPPGDGA